MAKFCVNCGTKLDDNARFCPNCGTPAAPAAQPQQSQQPPQQPVSRQEPGYQQPQQPAEQTGNTYSKQPAYKQQGYWQSSGSQSGGGQTLKSKLPIIIAAVAALALIIVVIALISKGCGGNGGTNQNAGSLRDYAQRLEAAGNEEAAAAIYDLIAQGGSAEMINKINGEVPLFNAMNELGYLDEIAYNLDGGE